MTMQECWIRALRSLKLGVERLDEAKSAADVWFAPYIQRDAVVHDGKGQKFVTDPETREQVLKETQLHPERPVKPYVFGPGDVQTLARHIRRELRLK
jgi:hypothetical protein